MLDLIEQRQLCDRKSFNVIPSTDSIVTEDEIASPVYIQHSLQFNIPLQRTDCTVLVDKWGTRAH